MTPRVHGCPYCRCGTLELRWSDRVTYARPDDPESLAHIVLSCVFDGRCDRAYAPSGFPLDIEIRIVAIVQKYVNFPDEDELCSTRHEALRQELMDLFRNELQDFGSVAPDGKPHQEERDAASLDLRGCHDARNSRCTEVPKSAASLLHASRENGIRCAECGERTYDPAIVYRCVCGETYAGSPEEVTSLREAANWRDRARMMETVVNAARNVDRNDPPKNSDLRELHSALLDFDDWMRERGNR